MKALQRSLRFAAQFALCLTTVLTSVSCTSSGRPPVASVKPYVQTTHGHTRVDDYYWLRQRDNPEVIAYLNAENRHTDAVMRHTRGLQRRLFREMKGRIKENDLSVPERVDDYFYYTRTVEGAQYRVHCRKRGGLDAPEEILLDENELAAGKDYFRLGVFNVSPDHNLLAYSVDDAGDETYTIHVKDLRTGTLLPDRVPNTYYEVAWANDNQTLFYNTLDAAKRPYRIYRHRLGTDATSDVLVHHEPDERFFVQIERTRSDRFLLLTLKSSITSEAWYLDADTPEGVFTVIQPRQQGMEYTVDHHGDDFYIVTNDNAVNFKLVKAPVAAPSKGNWVEVIPYRPTVKIDGVDAFKNHMAVYERDNGLPTLRIMDLSGGGEYGVDFPEPVYTYRAIGNPEFDTNTLRFTYASLVTPPSVFDYNVKTRTRELMKQDEVLGGYDPSQYVSERVFATASDGTQVPISLVYRRDFVKDGTRPALLDGYGSYGFARDPYFSSQRLSLLDRGFVFAIAHIRGGGDLGRPWYEDGKFLHKKNTFTDFIACAEYLIAEGYTSPDRLAITGGSAGGLLMGAVTNMRPDLFKAVVARVPFVDVINTMLDPTIPLTVIEYEEWGNPNDKAYYDYMLSYSPYDNVTAKAYPNLLITAGLNDPRVQYWEPAKWTAKLRSLKTDDNWLLLKTNMGAGHGGASGRYDALKETAFQYAFMLDVLGMTE